MTRRCRLPLLLLLTACTAPPLPVDTVHHPAHPGAAIAKPAPLPSIAPPRTSAPPASGIGSHR
jgi:hypothetical protein